ncbi:MAG: 3'-5' exonuclease [Brachymonas sp.]|nr:3'-5' exonuclease [Brachymonas sp.]
MRGAYPFPMAPDWWHALQRGWMRRQLRDPAYAFLFDAPPPDEWVSIDCETTGLDTAKDAIVSVAAVRIRGQRICTSERLELLVQPERNVPGASIRIHHLRETDVADGLPLQEAMHQLLHFIGSRPLVGYFLEFDVAMVNRAIKPMLGTSLPQAKIEVSRLYYEYKFRQLPPSQQHDLADIDLRFASMMADLALPQLPPHRALNDAVMAAMAFIKLRALKNR